MHFKKNAGMSRCMSSQQCLACGAESNGLVDCRQKVVLLLAQDRLDKQLTKTMLVSRLVLLVCPEVLMVLLTWKSPAAL